MLFSFFSPFRLGLLPAAIVLFTVGAIQAVDAPQGSPIFSHSSRTEDAALKLVHEALQNELAGDNEKRESLLRKAIEIPGNSAAHWQLGEILDAEKSAWLTPAQVELAARNDPRLAEYRKRREALHATVKDQEWLAHWCKKNKLDAETRAHSFLVDLSKPRNPSNLLELAQNPYREMMIAAGHIPRYANAKPTFSLSYVERLPIVEAWQKTIASGESSLPDDVCEKMGIITNTEDLIGMQQIVLEQSKGTNGNQHDCIKLFVKSLHDNPHPAAAEYLTQLATDTKWEDIRTACAAELKEHPFDHYVPQLLISFHWPIETDNTFNVDADGNLIKREKIYREGPLVDIVVCQTISSSTQFTSWDLRQKNFIHSEATAARMAENAHQKNAKFNDGMREINARIITTLQQTTGEDFSKPAEWWKWWLAYNDLYLPDAGASSSSLGIAYDSQPPKPLLEYELTQRQSDTIKLPRWPYKDETKPAPSSCFAPGTTVWTQLGKVVIEKIKIGDRVLSQNVETGELAYKPVLLVTLRPPRQRLKIVVGKESIIATPGHPFWVVGKAWRMVKELETGQLLHSISGGVAIESIERPEVSQSYQPNSYNLVVADFGSYFVGEQGILVHDNLPRQPTSALLPGLPANTVSRHKSDP